MTIFEQNGMAVVARIVVVLGVVFGVFVYVMVWAERKISAFIQDRRGPNRVGPCGVFQGVVDLLKFVFKEEVCPAHAHKFLFLLAPCLALFPAILSLGAIPMGVRRIGDQFLPFMIADVDVGVIFVFAVASLGVFGVLLGGWAANSKYPLLGGLRAAAQRISYEIPMGLSIAAVLILAGSARLSDIVMVQQQSYWFVFLNPLGFVIFLVCMFAKTQRLPFDLPEGDTEIIGYHAEYSSVKFMMFFMAEYGNMVTVSCLIVLMFFGGWEFLPFYGWDRVSGWLATDVYAHPVLWVLPVFWFATKVGGFLFLFVWVRWTLPRFRYDQLMMLAYTKLIPLGAINLVASVLVGLYVL